MVVGARTVPAFCEAVCFHARLSVRLSSDPAEVVQRAACTTVSRGQPQTTEWAAGPAGRRAFRLPGIQRPRLVPATGLEMEKSRQRVCRAEGEQAGHQQPQAVVGPGGVRPSVPGRGARGESAEGLWEGRTPGPQPQPKGFAQVARQACRVSRTPQLSMVTKGGN